LDSHTYTVLYTPPTIRGKKFKHKYVAIREMENISRGPTFGDFVTIRTERSMQDVSVASLLSTRAQTPLSPFF
jgi:hypothetical protein